MKNRIATCLGGHLRGHVKEWTDNGDWFRTYYKVLITPLRKTMLP